MATIEQTFAVSQTELFDALVNPDTYPHWLIGTRRIRSVSDDWPRPKSFFKHAAGFGPLSIADSTTVKGIVSPRMLELVVRARPLLEAKVAFDVESTSGGLAPPDVGDPDRDLQDRFRRVETFDPRAQRTISSTIEGVRRGNRAGHHLGRVRKVGV